MIHNEQARNNYPDPESFTERWQKVISPVANLLP